MQQSCIQGYSQAEDAMAFQAAGSVVISEYNWVDWYSTTIGQCPYAPDGLFVEDEEGSACFTGGVEGCNGNCTSGFPGTEATECVVGTTGQPLEYDVNTFYQSIEACGSTNQATDAPTSNDTAADGAIIRFIFRFALFDDALSPGAEIRQEDVEGAMCQTQYFLSQLVQNATDSKSITAKATEIDWGYFDGQDAPANINFTIVLNDAMSDEPVDHEILIDVTAALGKPEWQTYITNWVWKAEPEGTNFFLHANQVYYDIDWASPVEGTLDEVGCPETEAPTASPTISPAPTTASDTETTMAPGADGLGVVAILSLTAETSTLVEKMVMSGLSDELSGEGPFTLLAPTNDAFEAIYRDELDTEEFLPHLVDLLSYHVFPEILMSSDLNEGEEVPTLNSETVTVTAASRGIAEFNGLASVITFDLLSENGVTHIVDQVLLPQSYTLDMIGLAITDPDLSILVELLTSADLVDTLSGPGPFTLFAPSNAAFEALEGQGGYLSLEDDPEALLDLLTYHVTSGVWVAEELVDGLELTMLNDETATISLDPSLLIGSADVIDTDSLVNNGVIHKIGTILTPDAKNDTGATVYDVLIDMGSEFSELVDALERTGLSKVLEGDGPFTLFAPNNTRWETVDMARLNQDIYMPHLIDLLTYHVLPETVMSDEFVLFGSYEAVNEELVNVTALDPLPKLNFLSSVWEPDNVADNGVVHGVGRVLLPTSYLYDVVGVATLSSEFSVLVDLLSTANMFETLRGPGPFTVFAPPNEGT